MAAPTMEGRARAAVEGPRPVEGGRDWLLAVTEDYQPPHAVDTAVGGGVDRDADEVAVGERAIVSATLLGAVPADLSAWIAARRRQYGGDEQTARELMALRPLPPGSDERKYRRALARALQRGGPETRAGRVESHKAPLGRQPEYRERVGLFELQRARGINLYAGGTWYLPDAAPGRDHRFRWFGTDWTDPDDRQFVREVLAAGGAGFVAAVETAVRRLLRSQPPQLERVAGLSIVVMAGR